jgi:hypothetical protein
VHTRGFPKNIAEKVSKPSDRPTNSDILNKTKPKDYALINDECKAEETLA